MDVTIPLIIGAIAIALLGLGAVMDDRRARIRREAELVNVEAALPLLHSINDDRCIGCEACIDACPTEVLDLVEHKVRVLRFNDCVQCEQCANACPTMALVMYREGTTPRMLTVPELDEHFQTGVAGQYLIGEVAGKPLVKNAANLGRAVIEHVKRELGEHHVSGTEILDVAIVGSGPGGLSAGLTCLKRGLTCVVLEKEHVISSTVSRYPKGKHFMAEPSTSINVSFLPVFDASKEELVAAWQRVVDGVKMPVKLGEAVETIKKGDDGIFVIKSTVATYRARRVVLATGLRGKPRLLAVPGANLEKVQSLLDDPAEFAGAHVLVVGGGDSAVEGAMSLADVGATVVLSYRGDGFKRCKQGNQKRLAEMTSAGKLTVLLESNVKEFTPDAVSITLKDGSVNTYPNQRAFVLIGADTPVAWLETQGVRFVERPHLYTLGASDEVVRRMVADASECPRNAEESIALVLGTQAPTHRPSNRRVRLAVGHIADELRDAARDLSGVFRPADLEGARQYGRAATPRPHSGTGSYNTVPKTGPVSRVERTGPVALLGYKTAPVAKFSNRTPVHGDKAHTEPFAKEGSVTNVSAFAPERTVTGANAFAPERTVVGNAPIRPRSSKPAQPRTKQLGYDTSPLAKLGFDTTELEAFGNNLPVGGGAKRPAPKAAARRATTPAPGAARSATAGRPPTSAGAARPATAAGGANPTPVPSGPRIRTARAPSPAAGTARAATPTPAARQPTSTPAEAPTAAPRAATPRPATPAGAPRVATPAATPRAATPRAATPAATPRAATPAATPRAATPAPRSPTSPSNATVRDLRAIGPTGSATKSALFGAVKPPSAEPSTEQDEDASTDVIVGPGIE